MTLNGGGDSMKAQTLASFVDGIFNDRYFASTMIGGTVKRGTAQFKSAHLDRLTMVADKATAAAFQAHMSASPVNGLYVLTVTK
jgi:hypothetical protein